MMKNAIAILQILSAISLISFWVIFFLTEYKNRKMSEIEFRHELSFPLPDLGWIAPCSIVAAIGLLGNRNFGYFFSALAGSGMIFLSLIDLAFAVQNGKFGGKKYVFNTYLTMVIVIGLFILGSLFIIHSGVNLLK
jgi:hypothetical protein